MECYFCSKGISKDETLILWRINPTGVKGQWICNQCEQTQVELLDGKPNYIHSADCPNYCDYCCNERGFEQAEFLRKAKS